MADDLRLSCPQCGYLTATLNEGVCNPCREDNQLALDRHNFEQARWDGMTDEQRAAEIKRAIT